MFVKRKVGHRDIAITLGIYGHVLTEQRAEVADKVGSILFGPRKEQERDTHETP